ncbi:hypothetical protein FACS189485_20200 [Spirochaetia bacterium]|nr:hypothetical protein FACS189485_20200 [Spirochaetia bacterium]
MSAQNNDRFRMRVETGDGGGGNGPRKKPSRMGGNSGGSGKRFLRELFQKTGYFMGISGIPTHRKGHFSQIHIE